MKISSEWVHQPEVDQAGDAILAEGKVTLDTITAYQVATRLDRSANPSLYAKFRDWRARRRVEAETVTVDVPPEVEANIRGIFARLTDEGVGACLGAVRIVGGSFDRAAMLRIGDAERRADKAEAETADVVAIGEQVEEDLRAAMVRIGELEQAAAEAPRREDRLIGRLEQREADLAEALRHRMQGDTDVAAPLADCGDGETAAASDGAEAAHTGGSSDAHSICPVQSAPTASAAQLLLTFHGAAGESKSDAEARND